MAFGFFKAIDGLKTGRISPSSIPPIRVFGMNGLTYTMDNRRLYVFQQAGMKINTVPATSAEITNESWKFTTNYFGITIRMRGK